MSRTQIERESQARRELGDTRVSPGVARGLAGAFLALLFAVPLVDAVAGSEGPGWARLVAGLPDECALRAFEDRLEEASAVGAALRPWLQAAQAAAGAGNAQVYVGRDGWLYHRAAVDAVAGPAFLEPAGLYRRRLNADVCGPPPEPDPLPAIVHFRDQLAARGVALVVVPTPAKAEVEPGGLAPGAQPGAPRNASFDALLARLAEAGVEVFDPRHALVQAPREGGEPAYLRTDTHWRPGAMAAAAQALAERVHALAPGGTLDGPRVVFARRRETVANMGDVAALLDLPPRPGGGVLGYPPERVEIRPVTPEAVEGPAPVLLLGDSFSNIYARREAFERTRSGAALHWGADAGLPQQLAWALGRPVDVIARNDGGAWATRAELARELAAAAREGRDRLAGVRVVVWQFANRELAHGDWRRIPRPAAPGGPGAAQPAAGPAPDAVPGAQASVVRARVREVGPLPERGGPYPEALFAVRLADVRTLEGPEVEDDVVVYLVGVREAGPAPAAALAAGDRVELRLRPWADAAVQQRYGALRRTELDDPDALLLPAWFGEVR